ncbi:MAG: hypothetical protein JRJ12_15790 [Deltaproteobacteria bacterium]|nr:hypothetical protein [Deltaproteobacteria bacterium]
MTSAKIAEESYHKETAKSNLSNTACSLDHRAATATKPVSIDGSRLPVNTQRKSRRMTWPNDETGMATLAAAEFPE